MPPNESSRKYCPQCHQHKLQFQTQKEADLFISYNAEEIRAVSGYAPIRSYYCTACCCWHTTSKEKRGCAPDGQPRLRVLEGTVDFPAGRHKGIIRGDAVGTAMEVTRLYSYKSPRTRTGTKAKQADSAGSPAPTTNLITLINHFFKPIQMIQPELFLKDPIWSKDAAKKREKLRELRAAEESRRLQINALIAEEDKRYAEHLEYIKQWQQAHPACVEDAELAIFAVRQLKFDVVGRYARLPWPMEERHAVINEAKEFIKAKSAELDASLKACERREELAESRLKEICRAMEEEIARKEAEAAAKEAKAKAEREAKAKAKAAAAEKKKRESLELEKRKQEAIRKQKQAMVQTLKEDEELEFFDEPDPNAIDTSIDNQINVLVYTTKSGMDEGIVTLSDYLGKLLMDKGYYTATIARTKDGSLCLAFGVKSDIQIDINHEGHYFFCSHKYASEILAKNNAATSQLNIKFQIGHKANYTYIKF